MCLGWDKIPVLCNMWGGTAYGLWSLPGYGQGFGAGQMLSKYIVKPLPHTGVIYKPRIPFLQKLYTFVSFGVINYLTLCFR